MSNTINKLTTKRFVIRKSLIGTNTIITFTTKKGKTITYNVSRNISLTLIQTIFQHSVDNIK